MGNTGPHAARRMKAIPISWLLAVTALFGLAGGLRVWGAEPAQASFFDGWRLRLGPSYRQIDGITVDNAPSYVQQQGLHANGTGSTVTGQVGPESLPASRAYDDGFVNPDAGTPHDGDTWFWGYAHASQYSGGVSGAATLSFSAAGLIGDAAITNRSLSEDADEGGYGLLFSADRPLTQVGSFDLVAGFDLSLNQIGASAGWQAYHEDVYTVTDLYDVSDIAPPSSTTPPFTAPYAGTLAGPGPVISNTPDLARNLALEYTARNRIDLDMDMQLLALAACVGLEKGLGQFRIAGRVGLSLTWSRSSTERDESWFRQMPSGSRQTMGRWSDHSTDNDLIPGALAELRAEYQLSERWFLGASGRWDEPFSDVDVQVGPNEVTAELKGLSASVFVGYSF